MATFINVTTGGDDLLNRVKDRQMAGRLANQEQQRRKVLEKEVADKTAKEKNEENVSRSLQPLLYQRDLTATRYLSGGVAGVAYRTSANSADRTITLEVGTPGFEKSVIISGINDPGQRVVNDITLPASGTSGTDVGGFPGLHYTDSFFVNSYQVWSGLSISGAGSPPMLYSGPSAPPMSVQKDTWVPHYTQILGDKSQVYVLPAGPGSCVFVYHQNKFKLFNVFRKIRRRSQSSVNPRSQVSTVATITGMTWYDARQEDSTIYEFDHVEQFAEYSAHCVIVSSNGVREIPAPAGLMALLRRISPPVTSNSKTTTTYSSGGGQYITAGPPYDPSYFYALPTTTQQVDGFSNAVWEGTAAYGAASAANEVLAKQFGMGYLNEVDHKGNFFTPAVFQYLGGNLSLSGAASRDYAAMRAAYYPRAPRKFLAPCVEFCLTSDTQFYVTQTQPATTTSMVPNSAFKKDKAYLVKNGESSPGDVFYAWDWGDKASCRASLLALGFSSSDLVP